MTEMISLALDCPGWFYCAVNGNCSDNGKEFHYYCNLNGQCTAKDLGLEYGYGGNCATAGQHNVQCVSLFSSSNFAAISSVATWQLQSKRLQEACVCTVLRLGSMLAVQETVWKVCRTKTLFVVWGFFFFFRALTGGALDSIIVQGMVSQIAAAVPASYCRAAVLSWASWHTKSAMS